MVAAFLLFGFRNAGTPLLIASTPVSAAQPDEKALASRKAIAAPVSPLRRLGRGLEVVLRALGHRQVAVG